MRSISIGSAPDPLQLQLHHLAGEQGAALERVAVQQGDQETGPERVTRAGCVLDLDGTCWDVADQVAVLGDQDSLFAHREDHDSGPHIVEHLDVLLGFVIPAEDAPGVVQRWPGDADVLVHLLEDVTCFLVVRPDPRAVVRVERHGSRESAKVEACTTRGAEKIMGDQGATHQNLRVTS